MPIDTGVWRIDGGLKRIEPKALDLESRLEDILDEDLTIASPNWMVIGRQVRTAHGKFIDLLAIDSAGNLVILELKRDRTARDIVAQVLDYGSWVRTLEDIHIVQIYTDYLEKYHPERAEGASFDSDFLKRFDHPEMPDELNAEHELVIVASELDASTERVVGYLAEEYGVRVNAIFFRVYKDVQAEYMVRAWLREPTDVDEPRPKREGGRSRGGSWNGEYYVSFGHDDDSRNWSEARQYGFISAGGGSWYTGTLDALEPGARVWVNVPGRGFVGVAEVLEERVAVDDFLVEHNGEQIKLLDVPGLAMGNSETFAADPERAEYLVRVKWLHSVPLEDAVWEKGFFANQNTVAKPRAQTWSHAVERLKKIWKIQ